MKGITLIIILSFFLIIGMNSCSEKNNNISYSRYPVIPEPAVVDEAEGFCRITRSTLLDIDTLFETHKTAGEMFNSFLSERYNGFTVREAEGKRVDGIIRAGFSNEVKNSEGYILNVDKDTITILANSDAGLFYAFQTLMQLIYPSCRKVSGALNIPCVHISDQPAYRWRGLHLDVSRHFFPKEFIFKILDAMAMHKLNTFHWHLTDDQGWRIEIKRYPELAKTAAWRDETLIGHGSETPWVYDGKRYGGYYSQDDIREIVSYASKLHINVLPEIEMPGHAVAALRAYPELSCTGGPVPPFNRWGVSEDVFCAGKEETFEFLTGVLEEVSELFPYEYIHIGGDECPKTRWKECPLCQNRMKENNLKDENELQSYFIKRIETFLQTKGKKIIGWDEILEGGIAGNAAVMSWRGHAGGIEAARLGHDVVMTPHLFVYFDYYQSQYNEPLAIGGLLDMKKVYSIDIMPDEIEMDKRKHIIGAQANVWTEYMPDEKHVEYMIFPRLSALAEALWTPRSDLDFDDFSERMNAQYARYDAAGIGYRVPYPEGYRLFNLSTDKKVTVKLSNNISGSAIYYTLNGGDPDEKSLCYSKPLELDPDNNQIILRSVTVMPGGRKSTVMTGLFRYTDLKEAVITEDVLPGLRLSLFKGEFGSVNDFNGDPDSTGIIETFRLPEGAPAENYGLLLEGFIKVPSDGIYSFYTRSDDGVIVSVDDELVVYGDKTHHGITNEGESALRAGMHSISVRYFQRLYRQSLNISWEGPATPLQTVPSDVLYH